MGKWIIRRMLQHLISIRTKVVKVAAYIDILGFCIIINKTVPKCNFLLFNLFFISFEKIILKFKVIKNLFKIN